MPEPVSIDPTPWEKSLQPPSYHPPLEATSQRRLRGGCSMQYPFSRKTNVRDFYLDAMLLMGVYHPDF